MKAFNSKWYEFLRVWIFGHIKEYLPVDTVWSQNDIIFANHQEVVVNVGNEAIIFNVVVEPVEDKDVHFVIVKVLSNKVSFLKLTYDVQSRCINVNSITYFACKLILDGSLIIRKGIEQQLITS